MIVCGRQVELRRRRCTGLPVRRWLSASSLAQRLQAPVQSYISSSHDPFINLSIEHHLFQKSTPASAILFIYVNRPSIIIGRNQNPWLETNLALLNHDRDLPETEPSGLGAVDLVRRRSGGGTVFHDEGNVNWTVICDSSQFTRDKHVEMVVRALRACGVERARVNERHDVVLDQGERHGDADADDTHRTAYTQLANSGPRPLKVSGSAYKLTRGRALHHGTCLLSSPNLNVIPHYLHSPAKPYINARGVESVSSPVSNILVDNGEFIAAVKKQFAGMYSSEHALHPEELDEELLEIDDIATGHRELKSLDWTYLQTPQFSISNSADSQRTFDIEMISRHGEVTSGHVTIHRGTADAKSRIDFDDGIVGKRLHEVASWEAALERQVRDVGEAQRREIGRWLQKMLPVFRVS